MASDPTRIAGYPLTRFWLIPRDAAAEGVHAASDVVARPDSPRHAVGVGSLLQHPGDLGAREHHQVAARAARCS